MEFVDVVLAVDAGLTRARIPHAFGGALALGFVASPRGTVDIDVNVFVAPDELGPVDDVLAELGYVREAAQSVPIAGVRFRHDFDPFPIDVFPALDDRYEAVKARVTRHRFGPGNKSLPFLSAEDLPGDAVSDPPIPRTETERNRMLMAALHASEATLRAR